MVEENRTINGTKVLKGTWVIGMKITEPKLVQAIRKGDLLGLSVGGSAAQFQKREPVAENPYADLAIQLRRLEVIQDKQIQRMNKLGERLVKAARWQWGGSDGDGLLETKETFDCSNQARWFCLLFRAGTSTLIVCAA